MASPAVATWSASSFSLGGIRFGAVFTEHGLARLTLPGEENRAFPAAWARTRFPAAQRQTPDARERDLRAQLARYLRGELRAFEVDLDLHGTPFQRRVWAALQRIPYGETRSYGAIAHTIRNPTAVRAVGAANGANPVSIIVPCHRVIGATGDLTGYGGGLAMKKTLLTLEQS